MRCGAFHRVEGTLCLVRHGQAALRGSKTKAPGFAGGYLLQFTLFSMGRPRCDFLREVSAVAIEWVYGRDDLLEQVRFEREVAVPTSKCTTARFTGRPSEAARFGWMETC